jgi:LytS/YehU family sensor histidine kinase
VPPNSLAPATDSATPGWLVFAGLALRKSYNGLPLYLLIAALSHAFFFWRNLREREGRVSELEERLMIARAQMLRLQLEPHFLFNTLNAIGTVVYRDAALADDLITQLSTLLRRLLEVRDEYTMPLKFEMQTLRAYVAIEKARFGERLEFEAQVSEAANTFPVPVMLLQPLAENAVRHGIEPSGRTGLLKVVAAVRGDYLDIAVEDDGIGIGSGATANSGFGLGLASAKFRIQTLYGDAARLEVMARAGGGTRIEICLPRENRMGNSSHDEHG